MDQFTLMSVWLQLELCAITVLLTKGEIRCYCDAPQCVATGYMCKSEINACFTKVRDALNTNSAINHGCLNPIAIDICSSSLKATDALTEALASTLKCCHTDMCNYRGLHALAQTRDSTDMKYLPDSSNSNLVTRVQELASTKEVWFRAAVIAVPIAGGLILVLLIMLALRMLRSENKRLQDQQQQMLSRLYYSFQCHHNKKGHVAKLDMECMVPVTGHENCCLTCDKMRQADLGNDKILSLFV
uniref:BMP and activin membrane-bound inhibitor homolog n=1 Tax=Anabas testudineus TaxID=64144 RepID=A0A3Q1JLQ2_ANATE